LSQPHRFAFQSPMSSYSNLSRDYYDTRLEQAVVKLNGKLGMTESKMRADGDPNLMMFKPNTMPNDATDQMYLLPDLSPCYYMTRDYDDLNGMEPSMTLGSDVGVEVYVALNGLIGLTREKLRAQIEPAGTIEMGNADNRSTRVNVRQGGSYSIMYNGTKPARLNALLELDVPTEDEADLMESHVAAQATGRKGVTPLMFREYDPKTAEYLRPEGLLFYLRDETAAEDGIRGSPLMRKAVKRLVKSLSAVHKALEEVDRSVTGVDTRDPAELKTYLLDILADSTNTGVEGPITTAVNEFIRATEAVKLDRTKWVGYQTQQVALPGRFTPVNHVNYAS
jgi:hypothetical protein